MPPLSSDNPAMASGSLDVKIKKDSLPWKGRLLMLLLNFIPLAHILVLALILSVLPYSWTTRLIAAALVLYLLPPILGLSLVRCIDLSAPKIQIGSGSFFAWWALFQLQVLFCRLPALEEILRLIPGIYSVWLRLWGAKIGRLTYWSAGTLITDRSFLEIGDDVVLGAGVRLNAHVLAKNESGQMELILAPIFIGKGSVLGGYSLLTAGTRIAENEVAPAFLISPPFAEWKDGRRVRKHSEDHV